jgi:trimeric autotransporter adhesin
LFDGRRTRYSAVFRINRVGTGYYDGAADDGRDVEYITSAVAQQGASHDEGTSAGVSGILAAADKPDGGLGQLKSTGGAGGAGVSSGDARRHGTAERGQFGMKTVAEAKTAKSARMRVPITAHLELYQGNKRLAVASTPRTTLTQRVLDNDLKALRRMEIPRREEPRAVLDPQETRPAGLAAWRTGGMRLPMEAQVNGFEGAPQVRQLVTDTVREAGGGKRFWNKGEAAAYTLREAVSTEWLIAALPLLTSAGAELPPVHASGAEGQDLRASLHARLRAGRVLGVGDKMTFETVGQSHTEAPRPSQTDGQSSTAHGRSARGLVGAGLLNADEFRLKQLMGSAGGTGGSADAAANASGSLPLHKPKSESVLIQFALDVRVVARVTNRMRPGRADTAVREQTLPRPAVIRMPAPVVRRLLAAGSAQLTDPDNHLALRQPSVRNPADSDRQELHGTR